mmetsp:Transcript_41707/g.69424  ORF Transcript_41707/g.69424 Transcript_41707/m.69424 type:complete len:81 (+) Transcript_41707:1970-2212(+)
MNNNIKTPEAAIAMRPVVVFKNEDALPPSSIRPAGRVDGGASGKGSTAKNGKGTEEGIGSTNGGSDSIVVEGDKAGEEAA